VRLGLLIDRKNHQVYVYRSNQEPEILDNPDSVSCEPEMSGFALKMAKIW
jgi:Uma2 family endonuclease